MSKWRSFLKVIEDNPKGFARAIVDCLDPPNYVAEAISKFKWVCHVCWKPRVDQCMGCDKSICEEHIEKTLFGMRTKLEWYLCPICVRIAKGDLSKYEERVDREDEEFFLEDQEEEAV